MEFESLGGARNAREAKKASDTKMEHSESQSDFHELSMRFAKFAARQIQSGHEFMSTLREDPAFQQLKNQRDFDDESSFSTLVKPYTDYIEDTFDIEDERQQAAFVAILARMDTLQDDDMRKRAALENHKNAS